jgi:hypothetical protein
MDLKPYEKALDFARTETERLLRERSAIDTQLLRLKETVNALSALLGAERGQQGSKSAKPGVGHLGISESIRQILAESGAPMKPPEIRAQLSRRGFEMREYANPLAVIHNTLTRLGKQNELIVVKNPAGEIAYAISKARKDLPREGTKP